MPKLDEKKEAIWIGFWSSSGQAGGHRVPSQTDLRSDQEQEFQETPNSARARGAPDCVCFAMPAGLLSENGYNSENLYAEIQKSTAKGLAFSWFGAAGRLVVDVWARFGDFGALCVGFGVLFGGFGWPLGDQGPLPRCDRVRPRGG